MSPRLAWLLVAALALTACGSGEGVGGGPVTASGSPPTTAAPDPSTEDDPFALPEVGSFTEVEVTVGADPYPLTGTVRVPAEATPDDPVPGVVVVHGSGPQDEDGTVLGQKPYRDLAEGLADRGVAVLTYEKRTRAYPDTYGPDAAYTVQEEVVDDAVSALGVLRDVEGVDPERVVLAGHGLGAMLAPRIVAAGGPVAALVLLAPPGRPLEEVLASQVRHLAELDGGVDEQEAADLATVDRQVAAVRDPDLEPGAPARDLFGFVGAYWLDLRGYDPVEAVRELDVPVLVLWGERDYQVTADDVAAWEAAAQVDAGDGAAVQVRRFPELNHNFVAGEGPSSPDDYARAGAVDPAVVDAVASFVSG